METTLTRFLVTMPETRQGRRPFKEPPENWPALARFHRRLGALLDEPLNLNVHGDLEPRTLALSAEAKTIWVDFHNEVETELLPGGEMAEARDVASKAADNAVRLAALFHCFEEGPSGPIGPEHMTAGAVVAAWHLFEARRFMGELALPLEIANAARLDAWLVDYCKREGVQRVSTRQILQYGPAPVRWKSHLDLALVELEEAGRVKRAMDGKKLVVDVNPRLL